MDAQCQIHVFRSLLVLMEQQFVQQHVLSHVLQTICTVMVALMSMDVKSQTHVSQMTVRFSYISIRSVTYYLIMNSFEGKCTAICPTICPPDQETCPGGTTGGTNTDGCPMPDTCLPKTFGTDGTTVCTASCPVPCAQDHLYCDGGFDIYGCKRPNTCVPKDGIQYLYQYKIGNL